MSDPLPPDRTLEQWRLLLEQTEGRLTLQSDEMDGLDRKATTVLAATGIVLGLVINNADSFATSQPPVLLLFYGALVVLAAGIVWGVRALWPQDWRVVPEPGPLIDKHKTLLPEFTTGELLTTKAKAFEHNVPVTQTKANRIRVQMVLLALGGVLLVAAYVLERLI
jgi:hypothetical protein